MLVSAGRSSIIPDLTIMHAESVREVLNTVEIARRTPVSFNDLLPSSSLNPTLKKLCLLNIDPYPHHVVASLHFVTDHLVMSTESGSITRRKMKELGMGVIDTLELLPQCSQSLQDVKNKIQSKLGVYLTEDALT